MRETDLQLLGITYCDVVLSFCVLFYDTRFFPRRILDFADHREYNEGCNTGSVCVHFCSLPEP